MDVITISGETARALNKIQMGFFQRIEEPGRMATTVLVLRRLDDRPEWFPKGKWATIQAIEDQLNAWADQLAAEINASGPDLTE